MSLLIWTGTAGKSCWTAAVLRTIAAGGDSAATVLCYWCCQFSWKMIAASILSWEEIAAAVCWYKALLRRKKKNLLLVLSNIYLVLFIKGRIVFSV
jgi:hypothetical protein